MTKDKVLTTLLRSQEYVSGEEISNNIGLSRAAVNAAVKQLRNEGYEIDSVTNKGYLLKGGPDLISPGSIGAYLRDERINSVLVADKVDSTNKFLRELAYDGASSGQVVISNEQTLGRGRMGRSFFSPKDKGIYFSYLVRPECSPQDAVTFTAWTAVACVNAIAEVSGMTPGIKWVNDLVSNGRKLCGILTEMSIESETGRIDSIIIGIGININNSEEDFPENISKTATSIAIEAGHPVDRSKLAASLIKEMDKLNSSWPSGHDAYLEAYRGYDITCGREVNVISQSDTRSALALEINDDFTLKVKYSDGKIEDLSSGEVSLKLF